GARNTRATSRAQPIRISAPDHHCSSAQAQSFGNIPASTNTTIQKHFDMTTYARHHFRQDAQSRRNTVELAAAVIGNDQRACSNVHCATGIVSGVNPLYYYRCAPRLSNPVEII